MKSKICMFVCSFMVMFLGLWTTPVSAATYPSYSDLVKDNSYFLVDRGGGRVYLYVANRSGMYAGRGTPEEPVHISTGKECRQYTLDGDSWKQTDYASTGYSVPLTFTSSFTAYSNVVTFDDLKKAYQSSVDTFGDRVQGDFSNLVFPAPLLTPTQAEDLLGAPTRTNLQTIVGSTICLVVLGVSLVVLVKGLRQLLMRS